MIARVATFAMLALIPMTWGAIEVATGDPGGWGLVAFGIAAGVCGACR